MAFDIAGIMQSAPQMLRDLPLLINITQAIFYAGFALTLGGYIMKAYGGFIRGALKWVGRLAFGFLAVVCGIGLSWLFPYFSEVYMYKLMQALFLNVVIGGIIAAVVLFFALKMVSHNIFNIPGMDSAIKSLQERKKKALDVEKKEKLHKKQGIRHPIRLAGVILLAGFLIVSLMFFQGFPDPMEELGFSQDDLENMAQQMEEMDELVGEDLQNMDPETLSECMRAAEVLSDQATIAGAKPHTDNVIENLVEEETGEEVTGLYSVTSGPDTFIFAMTETQTCLATTDDICMCQAIA